MAERHPRAALTRRGPPSAAPPRFMQHPTSSLPPRNGYDLDVTVDLGVWTAYGLALAGPTPDRAARLAVHRAVATLHRAYAFWHWRRTVPWQPFPTGAADRRRWVASLLPPLA